MTVETVTGLICAECTEVDDPRPWCDCQPDERCTGPCRWRAHAPKDCPFLTAYVPMPTPWRLVKPGDTIRQANGALVHVTGAGEHGPGEWRIDVTEQYWSRTLTTADPDYPVPVLVPYAERAAELVLRDNDRARGHRSEMIDRG